MVRQAQICKTDPAGDQVFRESCENLLIVTNEIFSDGIGYDEMTKDYIRQLGWLNHELAGIADTVYEVVYGIPVRIKG